MIRVDSEGYTKEVNVPLLQHTNNRQKLLFMYRVVKFCAFELDRVKGNQSRQLQDGTVG